jgi:hypothetical protein
MMNTYEFLNKLNKFLPSNESAELFEERVKEYADVIFSRIQQEKCQYDYDKIFTHILTTYKYKTFPSLADIINALPIGKYIEADYSGREGEVIKRSARGYEYEFTVVPNHWDRVKSIDELDNDIKFKYEKTAS